MLAVVLLSTHQVSSSKTVRPYAPCGAQCIGHAVRTWSVICSKVPHSKFGKGARPHLCMDEWNCLTPVCRQLSLTQAAQGKPIPRGLAPVPSFGAFTTLILNNKIHKNILKLTKFLDTLHHLDRKKLMLYQDSYL